MPTAFEDRSVEPAAGQPYAQVRAYVRARVPMVTDPGDHIVAATGPHSALLTVGECRRPRQPDRRTGRLLTRRHSLIHAALSASRRHD
jgi:hypothetical protein